MRRMAGQALAVFDRRVLDFFCELRFVMALETKLRREGGKPELAGELMGRGGGVHAAMTAFAPHLHGRVDDLALGLFRMTFKAVHGAPRGMGEKKNYPGKD